MGKCQWKAACGPDHLPQHPSPYSSTSIRQVETQRLKQGQLKHPLGTHDSGNVKSKVSLAGSLVTSVIPFVSAP